MSASKKPGAATTCTAAVRGIAHADCQLPSGHKGKHHCKHTAGGSTSWDDRTDAAPAAALPEEEILTRAELPPWVKPDAHHVSNVSIFFHRPGIAEVWQAVFAVDIVGATFLDLSHHTLKGKRKLHDGDVTPLPGCVLIAVGVEQLRRARAGR